jgi:hypothetical protein
VDALFISRSGSAVMSAVFFFERAGVLRQDPRPFAADSIKREKFGSERSG